MNHTLGGEVEDWEINFLVAFSAYRGKERDFCIKTTATMKTLCLQGAKGGLIV